MAPTMDASVLLGAPTVPSRTFFPRSRVLLERRPVTFDSDDEEGNDCQPVLPRPPEPARGEKATNAEPEVAYVHEGRVESARFDLRGEELVLALQSLPRDAWTTLLDESDRRRLAAYLPSLDGWKDMPNEDAQRMAVEALLSRENLHFGNPLTTLEAKMRDGQCTAEATRARETYKKLAAAHFALERDATLRTRAQSLERKKMQDEQAQGGDPTPPWKKIRVASPFPFIHRNEPIDAHGTVLVSEDKSIFLALRSVLAVGKLTIDEIVKKLRLDFPRECAASENGIPLFLTFDRYIKAALTFLSDEKVSADSTHWSTAVFVQFDPDSKQYEWRSVQNGTETRSLLLLEQVFLAPVASDSLDYSNNSSRVKATRKRRERILTQRARDALLASNPSFAALDAYQSSRPSIQLKQSLLARETSHSTRSDLGASEQS